MNILILNGSPRENGTTAQLIDAFKRGLTESVQCVQVDLYSLLPMPCIACSDCATSDCCRFSDLDETDALLRDADVLVWALPVYNYSVPAPVKALLDRFQRYYEAVEVRKEDIFKKKNRTAVLLLSAGRSGLHSVEIIEKQLQNAGRYIAFELQETVFAPDTDKQAVQTAILEKATLVAGILISH